MDNQVVATGRLRRLARIIGAQVGVSFLVAALLLVTRGKLAALSAVVGGAAAFIPAILYVRRMLAVSGTDPKRLLAAQFRAEAFKFVGTVVIFGCTFKWFKEVQAVWLFASYFAALLVYFAALLFDR